MRKIFVLLLFICVYTAGNAQNAGIRMRVHYAVTFHDFYEQEQAHQDEMVLDIEGTRSHFYSLWSVRRAEIRDSISRIGGNRADMVNALDKSMYPRAKHHYQVWKNCPEKNMLTFVDQALLDFRFTASMKQPAWTIEDRDSTVCKYDCRLATTEYCGRKWQVWYAKDIPVSDGPWNLYGLPGLILEAKDSEGKYTFSCMEVRKGTLRNLDVPQKNTRTVRRMNIIT